MILLILFAFLAGIVTVLSPCILPVLPIILSGATGGGKQKPLGIVTGFIASFTFFTLFLTTIVQAIGIPADSLRVVSIVILFVFGLSLLLPFMQAMLEQAFSMFAGKLPSNAQVTSFGGGVLVGFSLGLLWTPCVGPILASVLSLALTGTVNGAAVFITLAYALGTGLPMLAIMIGGQSLLQRNTWLLRRSVAIQKGFGVVMMATAVAIYFNVDRRFQTYILEVFPNYGTGLTKFEDTDIIKEQLEELQQSGSDQESSLIGKPSPVMSDDYGLAPELASKGPWINSEPLTLHELRGKVVLVDFWTYSCINCIRTLPYLRDWHAKYADDGLVIIGVHTPEFEFEKDTENVTKAVADFELTYPIVQDNEYATWRAFNNRYWPAKYLIDAKGHIRYFHFGEQGYDETEAKIQELLKEAGLGEEFSTVDNPEYTTYARTPETYLGYERMAGLVVTQKVEANQKNSFSAPESLSRNSFAF
ncbi:redoxin domain-containing protein, partial [Candidatus Woesebacteria bacterium]|nr:redoxin domain-containing protein [Candidatus Woesebacteria bacterium]